MDNIHGKMVYSYEKPMWHSITEPSLIPMSAEAILKERFGGGFSVGLRPIMVELNGAQIETGDFAIVRGDSPYEEGERVFGYCSERYHPLQPLEIARSFDRNVREPAETMAFLGHGEDMFISWKMPSFDVKVGDSVEMYGIVRSGFDTLKATRLFTSVYRPVCANTITLAENWAKNNKDGGLKGEIWKGKGVNKNLLQHLGYWMAHVQTHALREAEILQNFFGKLAKTPIVHDSQAQHILKSAYPDRYNVSEFYPVQLKDEKNEQIQNFNESQAELRNGIFELFAGAGTAITPDYWGMLNATSEYFCHVQASKKPIAESVMFGGRQKNIMQMVNVLSKE